MNKSYEFVPVPNPDEIPELDLKFAGAHLAMMNQFLEGEFPDLDTSHMDYQTKNEFILDADKPIQIAHFSVMLVMQIALQQEEIEQIRAKLTNLNN